ncbi:uncharacterized protein TRIVIDRAFT_69951 [Trichoderma virens Gv29-8]|uniref:Uncharacterized protein n=1 Tax=Hypocrea virens (strain Gv29-8 / FGSC 10586) TaxID=413071 RepID=G9MX05_HYPVG|nr:uncharacterized protein TRIVIDRAFT_69951 [Trichoderma virens Gv29-8]EHK20938.1 hypothetical protein TRIVIDRAFT_69951 [Trichoderma virens Gv29-8]UKZ52368.1 hypothetical protein TrVGV298_006144 [Trichoderma virens]
MDHLVTACKWFMLLAPTIYWLLSVYANGSLRNLAADVIKIDVPIVLAQFLCRVLCEQQNNASWGDSVEGTSYGILPISYVLKLPWSLTIRQHAETAFSKTSTYLAAHFDELATNDSSKPTTPRWQRWPSSLANFFKDSRQQPWHWLFMKQQFIQAVSRNSPAFEDLEKYLLAHMSNNGEGTSMIEAGHRSPGTIKSPTMIGSVGPVPTARVVHMHSPSFVLFCCLISTISSHCLAWMEQRYLAREMCLHHATFYRQYNNYDSMRRDDAEGNLNSLHFHEFTGENEQSLYYQLTVEDGRREIPLKKAKGFLMKVAGVERAIMQVCWGTLSSSLEKDIYAALDIASKMQR